MTRYADLFEQGKLGLTVYTPDAARSRLWGHLDHHIQQNTGLQAGLRQWIRHDVASVTAFYGGEVTAETRKKTIHDYERIPLETIQHGHLFVQLMITGPSLLTVWQGEDAIDKLLAAKGSTNPAESPKNTIRGSFWCDNAICNLTHTSDDFSEAERELTAIGQVHLLEREAIASELIPKQNNSHDFIAHSGILYLCKLMNRLRIGKESIAIDLPSSSDARETMHYLTGILQETATRFVDSEIAEFIDAYLIGDFVQVSHKLAHMPLTRWEQFVIQCGALSREKWIENNSR